jgi:hypothetical protein
MSPVCETDKGIGLLNTSHLEVTPDRNVESDIESQEEENYIVYFINENVLGQSPLLEIKLGNEVVIVAILDSGSEVNLISQEIYEKLTRAGTNIPVLPVENIVLVTAFGRRSNKIRIQAYVEFTIGADRFEQVLLVSSQLKNDIIGCQFLKEFCVCIDFYKGAISYVRHGVLKEHEFVTSVKPQSAIDNGCGQAKAAVLSKPPSTAQKPHTLLAECDDLIPKGAVNDSSKPSHSQTRAVVKTNGNSYDGSLTLRMFPEGTLDSSGGDSSLELYGAACDHFNDVDVRIPDAEVPEESDSQSRGSEDRAAASNFNLQVNSVRKDLPGSVPSTYPKQRLSEARSLRSDDVYNLVEQVSCLTKEQRQKLSSILLKYLESLTTKPGMCTLLKYKFQVVSDKPIVSFSRPIPFAQRPAVRELINQQLSDGILEVSNSPILNPITVVTKEGGKIRMCIDARKVNQFTIPDHERAPPIQELLQKFNGTKYLTSLDLSSAFHQIQLDEESRQFTAFLFDSTVYQFKRVPYGFKNALPAFIRAIKLALGGSSLNYVVFYVYDILIYSKTFDEHMMHIDTVLGKLTEAGFTINAYKCRFCREEVKFLGHRINRTGVSADPDRIAAILSYPAPRNVKQLRQFLGTCNFHRRFIINYASYVAPLTPLLKQGVKWKWTQESQDAFLKLRESFARSIHLVHPREELPYAIYTDASKLGISSILTQVDESGETLVVSTASRVLSPVERKYSTCEQELLAVVYALQQFRVYVLGHSVTVYSDNKALSFLRRCNLTSGRITRWVIQLQEFDLKIVHIRGANNHFADVLSRNPIGLNQESRDQILRPNEV